MNLDKTCARVIPFSYSMTSLQDPDFINPWLFISLNICSIWMLLDLVMGPPQLELVADLSIKSTNWFCWRIYSGWSTSINDASQFSFMNRLSNNGFISCENFDWLYILSLFAAVIVLAAVPTMLLYRGGLTALVNLFGLFEVELVCILLGLWEVLRSRGARWRTDELSSRPCLAQCLFEHWLRKVSRIMLLSWGLDVLGLDELLDPWDLPYCFYNIIDY